MFSSIIEREDEVEVEGKLLNSIRDVVIVECHYRHTSFKWYTSLSGKRVCDSPSIRVSEISVYYENRWVVPMLGKDLFTLHFAKA